MLRIADQQISLWEVLLPPEVTRLPDELARMDAYLDDERFVVPWRSMFDARLGRPSVPVDTLLRLLYLKHRYQLGYETLCREVADSITWRRFCRIPLEGRVPHPTTLIKLPPGRAGGIRAVEHRTGRQAHPGPPAASPQAAHRHHRGGSRYRPPH